MNATKALEKSGIIGLGYIEIGFRNLWNNKKTVSTLEDAKGLKIRSTPSKAHIATLKNLGINPTPISWGEVYTALQQKTVDGIDMYLTILEKSVPLLAANIQAACAELKARKKFAEEDFIYLLPTE